MTGRQIDKWCIIGCKMNRELMPPLNTIFLKMIWNNDDIEGRDGKGNKTRKFQVRNHLQFLRR